MNWPGDRVLHPENDYTLEIFSGVLGTVRGMDRTEQGWRWGWMRVGSPVPDRQPVLAHARLRHPDPRARRGEFPAVVIPRATAHAALLGRTLIHTAFTRARRLVVSVGQMRAPSMAVRDWRRAPRHTALGGLLDGTARHARTKGHGAADAGSAADEGWCEGLLA